MKTPIVLLSLIALVPVVLHAKDDPSITLDIGSPAPELGAYAWVKGQPVTAFEKGKTYLVEFWSTTCGPCIANIPHLKDFHQKFSDKGLVVIGMDVYDSDYNKVKDFVKAQGDKMPYRVAYAGQNGVQQRWLDAAGVSGIPHAFIIRDGKIIWDGHPSKLNDKNIGAMINGDFDASQRIAEKAKSKKYYTLIAEAKALSKAKKFDEAFVRLDELKDFEGERLHLRKFGAMRANILLKKGDADGALATLLSIEAKNPDGDIQLAVAEKILDTDVFKDKKVALDLAQKGAAKENNVYSKIVLARAVYAAGDKAAALATLTTLAKEAQATRWREEIALATAAVGSDQAWPKGNLMDKMDANDDV